MNDPRFAHASYDPRFKTKFGRRKANVTGNGVGNGQFQARKTNGKLKIRTEAETVSSKSSGVSAKDATFSSTQKDGTKATSSSAKSASSKSTSSKPVMDERFARMYTDDAFRTDYIIDKWGRKISTKDEVEEENDDEDEDDDELEQMDEEDEEEKDDDEKQEENAYEDEDQSVDDVDDAVDEAELSEEDSELVEDSEELANNEDDIASTDIDSEFDNDELIEDNEVLTESILNPEPIKLGDATHRIALLNLDWDRFTAADLLVLLRSFLISEENPKPNEYSIKEIAIYPSEFGKQRIAEEAKYGPLGLYATNPEFNIDEYKQKLDKLLTGPLPKPPSDDANNALRRSFDNDDEENNDENSEYSQSALRQYELSRLRYYYAVVLCSSVEAARFLYDQIDGIEFESSSNLLDARFIPEDVSFDDDVPRDRAEFSKLTPAFLADYEPPNFTSNALQKSKVSISWDDGDRRREKLTMAKPKKLSKAEERDLELEDDLAVYLGSGSEDDDASGSEAVMSASDDDGKVILKKKARAKYAALLSGIEDDGSKLGKDRHADVEIKFIPGLKEKAAEIVKKVTEREEQREETVWEKYVRERKEKRKSKKKQRKEQEKAKKSGTHGDSLISGSEDEEDDSDGDMLFEDDDGNVDMDDPFFAELNQKESSSKSKASKKKSKSKNSENEEEDPELDRRRAELELMMADDDDDNEKGYDLSKLLKQNKEAKKKLAQGNRRNKKSLDILEDHASSTSDTFQVDTSDSRFSALFTDPEFNIDPTDAAFKATEGAEKLIAERQRRRKAERQQLEDAAKSSHGKNELDTTSAKSSSSSSEINSLLASVKAKAKSHDNLLQHKRMRDTEAARKVQSKSYRGQLDAPLQSLNKKLKLRET